MNVNVLQEDLKEQLARVGHAVAGKSTLPVLSHVLLATDGGRLKIAATNLEIGITTWRPAKVLAEGAYTVPFKLFSDYIAALPNALVELTLDEKAGKLLLKSGRHTAAFKGIEADEFPAIPSIPADSGNVERFTIAASRLRSVLEATVYAAATDDTRPVLTATLMRFHDMGVTCAAADGFRLAVCQAPDVFATPVEAAFDVLPPARALVELCSLLDQGDDLVTIAISGTGGQIIFSTSGFELVSRLIEGKFPDFERIMPAAHTTRAILSTGDLAKAVKLASYFASASASIVKLVLDRPDGEDSPGRLTLSANAAEVGDNQSSMDALVSGEVGLIAINVKFFMEVLRVLKTPQIALELQTPQSPAVFSPVGDSRDRHVIMPMTVR